MRVLDFKTYEKNTLKGFFTLELFPWLHIKDCSVHESHGKRWFGFPGVPYQKNNETEYKNVIFVPDKAALDKLQAAVCQLLDEHLGGDKGSAAAA